jgi:hypothetical protein
MNSPKDEIVVLDIAGARAVATCGSPGVEASLTALGFTVQDDKLQRPIANVTDREKLVNALINLGALFASGRDWSPADVVGFYREQGAVKTGYRRISWTKPDQYVIVDC